MDAVGHSQVDLIKCVSAQLYIKEVLDEVLLQLSSTSWWNRH